ncbi:L,D-transpeptidase [Nostoc sp. NIES-2111]
MAPMPHSIFFRGGYAIHATNEARNLGRPASHGCIRRSKAKAAAPLARVRKEGATIAIDGTPRHTMVASAKTKTRVAKAKSGNVVARTRQPAASAALGYAPAQPSLIPDWLLR